MEIENYGRFDRDVVSPEVLPAGEVGVVLLSLSVIERPLVVELLLVAGRFIVDEPFVLVPVLLKSVRLPLVVGLKFVVLVVPPLMLPPDVVVFEPLRFIMLPFELPFPVSEVQFPPIRAIAKITDNVVVFFIVKFLLSRYRIKFAYLTLVPCILF